MVFWSSANRGGTNRASEGTSKDSDPNGDSPSGNRDKKNRSIIAGNRDSTKPGRSQKRSREKQLCQGGCENGKSQTGRPLNIRMKCR